MKTIEVDEDLYRYIASQTQHIGESASDILRRLLNVDGRQTVAPIT
ncbi:replication initiation regulator SeqA, partial [Vibrio vulnificus]|nr:replication initiation regulator SeqA [Vibrio vulnificus]